MHDSFWWDVDLGALLFSGLKVESAAAMAITCLVFVLLTVLFEGFKVLEYKVRRNHTATMRRAMQGVCAEDRSNLLRRAVAGTSSEDQNAPSASNVFRLKCMLMTSQVLLYTTNTGFNYLIMLVVMLYNGYLVLAIILGITIGYYLFGHISVKYKMERETEQRKEVTVCIPECEGPEGSTPPLLQGSGASETNLYSSAVVHSQTQHLLDQDVDVHTREADCGESSKVKKTTDISKIKISKDFEIGSSSKCCDKDTGGTDGETSGDSDIKDTIEVVSEKTKDCGCDRSKEAVKLTNSGEL